MSVIESYGLSPNYSIREMTKKKKDKYDKVVDAFRGKRKRKNQQNQELDRDAASVTVQGSPPPEDNSNQIHVGGIADFHEHLMHRAMQSLERVTRLWN